MVHLIKIYVKGLHTFVINLESHVIPNQFKKTFEY